MASVLNSISNLSAEEVSGFSHDQKLTVIQSILSSIPREQPHPWHESKLVKSGKTAKRAAKGKLTTVSGTSTDADHQTVSRDILESKHKQFVPKEPPLSDPYDKSIRYYERHQVLNHFQHMTAKLVLHRPENTLDYMIDWCKQMQQIHKVQDVRTKTLYEGNQMDIYDDDNDYDDVDTSLDSAQLSSTNIQASKSVESTSDEPTKMNQPNRPVSLEPVIIDEPTIDVSASSTNNQEPSENNMAENEDVLSDTSNLTIEVSSVSSLSDIGG